jgi:hypothetical protein
MGFEVVPHEPRRELINKAGESEGQGRVRVLESLSLHRKENAKNQLEMSIFNSAKTLPAINWEAIVPETKARWEKAREMVMADDKGNWGANFAAYAKLVSETVEGFEHIETPEKLYETQYQNLKRLAEFARNKDTGDKQVNVVSFGHENYMSVALAQDTGEESIANTEAVELTEDGFLKRLEK